MNIINLRSNEIPFSIFRFQNVFLMENEVTVTKGKCLNYFVKHCLQFLFVFIACSLNRYLLR